MKRIKNTALALFSLGTLFGTVVAALLLTLVFFDSAEAESSPRALPAPATAVDDVSSDDASGSAPHEIPVEAIAPLPQLDTPAPAAPVARPESQPVPEVSETAFLEVVERAAARGVERRLPVERGERFEANGERVWIWVKVKNRSEPSHIEMVWKHEGEEKWRAELRVGLSRGWRTNARRRMNTRDVGSWTVEILDAEGRHLDTVSFEVVPVRSAD